MKVTILVAAGKVDKNLEEVLSCEGIMVFENTEQSAIEALGVFHIPLRIRNSQPRGWKKNKNKQSGLG